MAAHPARLDTTSADGAAEIDQLETVRLTRNWSYRELAEDMRRAGCYVNSKTLQSLVRNRPTPWDRTLFQLRRYFESLAPPEGSAKQTRKAKGRAA